MREKTCSKCNTTKPITEFHKAGNGERYRKDCKRCRSGYRQKYYSTTKARRDASTAYVKSIKTNTPCLDCGIIYPYYVLDFDHCHGKKRFDVGYMAAMGYPLNEIDEEIAKCDIVCSNCHRVRTFVRRNDLRYQG